jgi:lipoyl(octanoyl) transferase
MADFSVQFHLLGTIQHEQYHRLQRRLVYEISGQDDGRIVVLLCEHPRSITVGRNGSRGFIRLSNGELRSRGLSVRWVSRGGGCVLHERGQLAIYPFVPLARHGWSVGDFLSRFRSGVASTLSEMKIRCEDRPGSYGIWGRSGQLVTMGVAVRSWISCHGAFLNVNPPMSDYAFVDVMDPLKCESGQKSTMGSLLAERRRAVTIQQMRSALIPNLASAFGTDRYHLITGHPLLPISQATQTRKCISAS